MASVFRKTYTKLNPQTGERETHNCMKWYIKYRDAQGIVRVVAGSRDKQVSKRMASQLETEVENEKLGIRDEFKQHRQRCLLEHLSEYEAFLQDQGRTAAYVATTVQRVQSVLDHGKMKITGDVSLSGVQSALAALKKRGRSVASCNHYSTAIKMFMNWMVKDQRIAVNPLLGLSKANVQTDRRHVRRPLTEKELKQLLDTTAIGPDRLGMTGEQRVVLYLFAVNTGLRRNELGSLHPKSFNLNSDPPTVTVEAKDSKHRRKDVLPLRQDVAEIIRGHISTTPIGESLFPISGKHSAEMLAADLRNSGIAKSGDDGQVLDFHSLRQTFITNLSLANVSPQMAMNLARHSDINLTLNTYTQIGMADQSKAVESLPSFGSVPQKLAPQLAPTPDFQGQNGAQSGTTRHDDEPAIEESDSLENLENTLNSEEKHTMPKVGLEPTLPLGKLDFESSASAIPPLRLSPVSPGIRCVAEEARV